MCHANVVSPAVGKLSSPGRRLGAYFLDVLIPFVAVFLMFFVGGAVAAAGGESGGGAGILLGLLLFVGYVVWALTLFARGTTPGKRALGMYVIKETGQRAGFGTMLFREWIGKWISSFVLMLGFLWILFDKDRQGWHDKLASTFVVEPRA
jgi:uncharacterized RDD family membrane protein YckC